MRIHLPSLAVGSAATAAVLAAALAAAGGLQGAAEEPALRLVGQIPPGGAGGIPAEALLGNAPPPLGREDAPVTIVEFGDYQCFYCSKFFNETEPLIVREHVEAGTVRLVFKDYTIVGPDSAEAAHAARCAADQGLFWEYHDALYGSWAGENTGWASAGALAGIAEGTGLDAGAWAACMEGGDHRAAVEASNADARLLGLTGTPSFFVVGPDGRAAGIHGAQPYGVFDAAIRAALGG